MRVITVARKPLEKGQTVAENALEHGTGALNIDRSRIPTTDRWSPAIRRPSDSIGTFKTGIRTTRQHTGGRYPANLILGADVEVEGLGEFFFRVKG